MPPRCFKILYPNTHENRQILTEFLWKQGKQIRNYESVSIEILL